MSTFFDTIGNLHKMSPKQLANCLWISEHGENSEINTEDSEYRSWINSLPILINHVYNFGMENLTLIMEYSTPMDSRIDAILVGYNKNGDNQIILIEDKQWSDDNIRPTDSEFTIQIKIGNNYEERNHPLFQLHNYINHLKNHHSKFTNNNIFVKGMAFTHNIDNTEILLSNLYSVWKNTSNGIVIGENDVNNMECFIKDTFINQSNNKLAEDIINGHYVLGKAGLDGLKKAIHGKENASMIKDQAPINAFICNEINNQLKVQKKEIIVVSGAAGTGKTILGFHAIYDYHKILNNCGIHTSYNDALYSLARNRTLRSMIDKINGFDKNSIGALYINKIPNNTNFVVIDEAHRISDINNTLNELFNKGTQIILVLQDDWQTIHATDEGIYRNFENYADNNNVYITHKCLNTQLRTGIGSNLTEIIDCMFLNKSPVKHKHINVKIEHSLMKMEKMMNFISKKGLTKWIAPFCWEWSRNVNKNDIHIYDGDYLFEHPWNPVGLITQYEWLTSKSKIEEVASIYSSQGLEFDYSGFIWWDDLKWNNDLQKWIYNLKECKDSLFKKSITSKYNISIEQANEIQSPEILQLFFNNYKTLLTRARKGMFIWFKDEDTRNYVEKFL